METPRYTSDLGAKKEPKMPTAHLTDIFAGFAFEWRIEYRGKDGTGVSPDPTDQEKTFRVLTLYAVDDVLA
jgi:hypothetical protein